MGNDGYIKVWRRLFEHPIWLNSTPEQKSILMALMGLANYSDCKWEWNGKEFDLKRGQMITSTASIMRKCGKGISEQNVKTALVRFEKLGFLTCESTKTGRLITIENYNKWQGGCTDGNQEINQDLTNTSPTPNQDLTTIKKNKNNKNITANTDIAETFQLLEKCGFTIDAFTAETLTYWIDELSAAWVQEAIKRSAKQGVRKLSYVEGILLDWKTKGAMDEGCGRDKQIKKSSGTVGRRDYSDANGIRFG